MTKRRTRRIPNCLTLRDAHRAYLKTIKGGTVYDVPQGVYAGVCRALNERMVESIIDGTTLEASLGPRLGKFVIVKRKTPSLPSKMRVDWKRTKELGALIYYENEHTKGYYCTFKWRKSRIMPNRDKYFFQLIRRHDLKMSEYFRTGRVDYPVYEKFYIH